MFKSEPMQKVRIVCLDNDKERLIQALHKLGILDLRKSKLNLSNDNAAEHFTVLSDMEIKLAGALALLKKPKKSKKDKFPNFEKHMNSDELISNFSKYSAIDNIYDLIEERKRVQQTLMHLEQSEKVANELSTIDFSFEKLHSNVLSFKAYVASNPKDMESFSKELEKKKFTAELIESKSKKIPSMIVAYKKNLDMDSIAKKYNLKELDLTLNYLSGKPIDALKRIMHLKQEEQNKIKSIEKELEDVYNNDHRKLAALMEMIKIEITKAQVSETFKKTDRTIIIEGWVPKKSEKELEHEVSSATKNAYYLEKLETDELAPTLSNKPKFLQPFDFMINFISVPRSDEVDPAIPFIISFPILYGLMVTDVGYGILSFLFAWWITTFTDKEGLVYNTAKIWMLSSVSAIVFGVLSNQYFGLQLNKYILPGFVGFDWFKNVTSIILVSVIFGVTMVIVGLILGFVNKYKHHKKIAFGRLTSVALILSGVVAISGGLFHVFNSNITLIAGIVAILSLIATIVLSGEEAGEITNLISHPLSFARLMGFGLASVVLAFLIDKAFTPSLSMGIPVFILFSILFIILHFLNMIVTMFEGAIQGARLNFIELFTKFNTGGGIKFNPFKSKRVYTKE
ncbi:MAG: V-type ATPase 116kDa subunit family protein [Candidatus Micrarchaeaceae archaeon]|jgi:V/A-type H+/Na+-transporting ATPase subunit I